MDSFSYIMAPSLDWMQVEVTSHCNASCVYCPHTVYRNSWRGQHMSMETFGTLAPYFRKTGLVYLQGWGEPLLHPEFFQMVRQVKRSGCRVGTTTNGRLLNEDMCGQMVDEGVDVVGFSLVGTTDTQDEVRKGTKLTEVLRGIEALNMIRERRGAAAPEVHLAYLVLRSQLKDIMNLPALLQGLGVRLVVLSTLDFVPSAEWSEEVLFPNDESEEDHIQKSFSDAAALGEHYGVKIHFRVPSIRAKRRICTENVLKSLFISANGKVSPCVFTNLPVSAPENTSSDHGRSYQELTFGNVNELPLWRIWRGKAYKSFRRAHKSETPPSPCSYCIKCRLVEPETTVQTGIDDARLEALL